MLINEKKAQIEVTSLRNGTEMAEKQMKRGGRNTGTKRGAFIHWQQRDG